MIYLDIKVQEHVQIPTTAISLKKNVALPTKINKSTKSLIIQRIQFINPHLDPSDERQQKSAIAWIGKVYISRLWESKSCAAFPLINFIIKSCFFLLFNPNFMWYSGYPNSGWKSIFPLPALQILPPKFLGFLSFGLKGKGIPSIDQEITDF